MLNRKTPPQRHTPNTINILRAEDIILPNGIRLLKINAGSEDVCRLDLNFAAGSRYQKKRVEAKASISMLSEGTANFTSHQIAEQFDFLGSFCEHAMDRDFSKVTILSLNKYLDKSLDILEMIVKQPTFPEKELETFRIKGKQSLIVELEKTSTLARQDFYKAIFGSTHPYGLFAEPSDYSNIQRDDIINFHKNFLNSSRCNIVVSGKVSDKEIDEITKHFGLLSWGEKNSLNISLPEVKQSAQRKFYNPKDDAVQSAIRIGRKLVNRSHPDYCGLVILNTILGGYFGSRLMKNIREDKGYTYGISSSILSLKECCVFVIGTEVGAEVTLPALQEIYSEIERLTKEPVSNEELDLVCNFLLGELLRSFDGAFAIADTLTSLLEFNDLDYSFYTKMVNTIKTITPEELMNLANCYLRTNDLIECVAGPVSNLK